MMKFEKGTLKGFAAGTLVTVLTLGTILPSSAATMKEIKVAMGGIKIYVDGNLKKPTDVNGNVVEPMIYDGTTYLPVRALTGMLTDKEVAWDQQSQTVYIGQRPDVGVKSVPIDEVEAYDTYSNGAVGASSSLYTGKNAQFTVLGDTYSPFNRMSLRGGGYRVYKLDSNYDSIHGKFIIPFDNLGSKAVSALRFYSVGQHETTLIKEYYAQAGDPVIDVDVNLQGCNSLKIEGRGDTLAFYDVTLTTAK